MGKRWLVAIIVIIIAIAGWMWLRKQDGEGVSVGPNGEQGAESSRPAMAPPVPVSPAVTPPSPQDAPSFTPPPAPQSPPLPSAERRDLGNPLAPASVPAGPAPRPAEEDPATAVEMDKVFLMIRDYRTITGENPIGTNAEIMKAMMGKNPRGAKLGPPEGMALNGEGELLDNWGTPLFFHQISRDVMEIHSAGPDRRLGTEDDLILK